MQSAREVAAKAFASDWNWGEGRADIVSDHLLSSLEAAGFRIISPGEYDPVTVDAASILADLEADRHNAFGLQGSLYQVAIRISKAIRALYTEDGK